MGSRDVYSRCRFPSIKKNGHVHNGAQHRSCKGCGRQFVECSVESRLFISLVVKQIHHQENAGTAKRRKCDRVREATKLAL
jgi:hypothetical protein